MYIYGKDVTKKFIFMWRSASLKSKFSFDQLFTKLMLNRYFLVIADGKTDGFMRFSSALAPSEK